MTSDMNIIWRIGDGKMPDKVEHVVRAARDELLLRSLQLPFGMVDTIRYNANKNDLTINEYISAIIVEHIETV